MRRSRRHNRLRDVKGACFIRSVIFGIIVTALCLIGFSAIMTKFDSSGGAISAMANIALCAGSAAAGYSAAKEKRHNGIITGLTCGAIIYGIVYLCGVFILGRFSSISMLGKLILVALFSAIGGVFGVNTKMGPKKS